ncbi:hypothetical protein L0Z21_10015 [Burkholderia multivorans]|uniref:hypothetical protein n=1 Tax=Burkholderia multivorans TaxID=87883 RepID=UPI002018D224|nr:hypothetical protein [Burkholderia multivorans]MCO1443553.1 hypothetical protein [Burkholderia multivorans]UQO27316.1 hypothetical protein L0Z21_10015 [Burkholderia multivorans]UQO40639.1 hypothetical protein L0Z43_10515 [Burkholderia multivorans]
MKIMKGLPTLSITTLMSVAVSAQQVPMPADQAAAARANAAQDRQAQQQRDAQQRDAAVRAPSIRSELPRNEAYLSCLG